MKYAISHEGVAGLRQLHQDMNQINSTITEAGSSLKNTVNGESEGLGVYASDILNLINEINKIQADASEDISSLSTKINEKADEVESLIPFLT